MPRKPRDVVPGPGEYTITPRGNEPNITKGGYIPLDEKKVTYEKQNGIPGPAYYNAAVEPKKISFLFNAAEKWTH
jgi:hypothetical protein